MPVDSSIKNLIFDLGGVILDLSVDDTLRSFSTLSGIEKSKVAQLFASSREFASYEKGEISDDVFRDFVRDLYKIDASDEELDSCWNAMLLGFPLKKLQLLETLKTKYTVYLLSNTNNIHLDFINHTLLSKTTHASLDDFFHRAYYSHRMKKRKPDAEIFNQVLEEEGLEPEQTLFLDDNLSNVKGASIVGIKTLHVTTPDLIFDYFS